MPWDRSVFAEPNMLFQRVLAVAIVLLLLVASAALVARFVFREQVVVGQVSHESARVPVTTIEHGAWDALLKKYVDEQGLVDYTGWHASRADREALEAYLAALSRADTSTEWPREAALAYWINAYNALTIQGILREYPAESIRNFTPRFWGYHIWRDLLLPVGDETVSLDEIEHGRLRPLGDFRIHFAIVCASRSCPPLRSEAYTAERVDEQLTAQARRFMNDPRNFRRVDEEDHTFIEWSALLAWYGDDLGPDRATRMHRLAKWIDDQETKRAAVNPETFVRRNEYDWSLNDAARPANSATTETPQEGGDATPSGPATPRETPADESEKAASKAPM
jgi:Protein of unknown function, DUF547